MAGEVIRAIFVIAEVGFAILVVFLTGWALVTASNPPATSPGDDPRVVGFDDVLTYGIAAMLACAGALGSVRLWLRGSWHVISVAIGTAFLMFGFLVFFAVNNWSQH